MLWQKKMKALLQSYVSSYMITIRGSVDMNISLLKFDFYHVYGLHGLKYDHSYSLGVFVFVIIFVTVFFFVFVFPSEFG